MMDVSEEQARNDYDYWCEQLYDYWCEQLAFEFPRVPEYTREAYAEVIAYKCMPGSFLQACINNDLFGAISRADPQNRAALHDIVRMIRSTTT